MMRENYDPLLQNSEVVNYKSVLSDKTLKELWICITEDQIFKHHQAEIIKSWALIPSCNQTLYSGSSPILPLVTPSNVNEVNIFEKLTSLGIPVLNTEINKEMEKYCLQLTNHDQVLAMLFHIHTKKRILDNLSDPNTTIQILFSYFSWINYRHDRRSLFYITSLPIFETINGDLTSIYGKKIYLWPDEFCKAGYDKWAPLDSIVFLHCLGPWKTLCSDISSLGGHELSNKDIYADFIFPKFHLFKAKEREDHLRYIKDNMYRGLMYELQYGNQKRRNAADIFLSRLQALNCLESKNGKLFPIKTFSDHTLLIFTTFPAYFEFVPDEYKNHEWLEFLQGLGLRVIINCDEFKIFCQLVSTGQHFDLRKASRVLIDYLFSESVNDWSDNDLTEIGDISFVQVDPLVSLRWIKAPYAPSCYFQQQKVGLTKLNKAVIYDSAPLVWTIKPVVSLPNMNYLGQPEYNTFLQKLGVIIIPEVNDVYTNLLHVSKTGLANSKLFDKYDPKYIQDPYNHQEKLTITDVIVMTLQHLFKKNADDLLQNLQTIPCIPVHAHNSTTEYDIKQPVLVKPIQVVRHLQQEDKHLFPYLHSLPTCLNVVNEVLDVIGISQSISIMNLQHLLETLYEKFKGAELDPNNKFQVRKAVMKLHELFKEHPKHQVIKPLYLPALPATSSSQYSLLKSSSLVFIDSNRYKNQDFIFSDTPYSLFQLPSDTKPSVVSSTSMATLNVLRSPDNMNVCLQLPKEVRPKGLSLCCTESILIRSESEDNSPLLLHFQKLKGLISSLNELLPKILSSYYRSVMMNVDDDDAIVNKFSSTLIDIVQSLPIVVIEDLRSEVWLMSKYCIGTMKVQFSLQKENDNYLLFVDVKGTPSYTLRKELASILCIEVARIHNVDLTTYLKAKIPVCECLEIQCPNDLIQILEKYNVEAQDIEIITVTSDSTLSLGKEIPNDIAFSLDRDIYHIFRPEEWVGYEIKEGYFIYAIILHPLLDGNDNLLAKKYKIIVDESEHGLREVSTLDLYKLMPIIPEQQCENQELVLADPDGPTAQVRQITDSQKLLEIKRTICKELKSVWDLKDEIEKRKAIKRLYLKYHPDKANPNERCLYEDVFKFLKRQIDRLEEGLPLEDPDLVEERSLFTPHPADSRWTRCYNNWDEYARKTSSTWRDGYSRRNTTHNHNRTEESMRETNLKWEMIFNLQPKTDKVEAKRWLKQAESDLRAMIYLKEAPSALSCQVLFLAHEASEKALKAGMYALVGLNPSSLKTHNLVCHAYAISSEKGGDWMRLPNLVSSMEQYYLDSRFPNKHTLPNAPVDIYTQAQAKDMADNAEEVVKLIRRCVD